MTSRNRNISANSRVIIVGNSPNILKSERGKEIDSYDVVIRINNCPTEGFEKFIGEKIDIWATTKNSVMKDFCPKNYSGLAGVWHRTMGSEEQCKLPKESIPKWYMYKTSQFKESFKKYTNNPEDIEIYSLIGTDQEFCTGLLTILTATLFFNVVDIIGFSFYSESEDGFVRGYYRDSQLDEDGKHFEDYYWAKNKKSGFTSEKVAIIKREILKDLESQGKIRIIDARE